MIRVFKSLIMFASVFVYIAGNNGLTLVRVVQAADHAPIDRQALVIGVGNYTHWPALPHALDNARSVARRLEASGYTVKHLQDPSSRALNAAFENVMRTKREDLRRSIVIYYCGQAESETLADGTRLGWIVPADCPSSDDQPGQFARRAVSTQTLASLSNQSGARYVIMLFDAAFDADLFDLKKPKISSFNSKNPLPVRQYIVAGSAGETVPKNNLFSNAFIQALDGEADIFSDTYVTGSELAVYLSNRMAHATGGVLHLQYGKGDDPQSSQGDFFFYQAEAPLPGSLVIQCLPENARIKILNITPRYHHGMLLAPGPYQLQITADGFATQKKQVEINSGRETTLKVELEKTKSVTVNRQGMTFRWIGSGRYRMGSPEGETGRQLDEQLHWVSIAKGFWMQTTEVTVGQFQEFISQTGYVTDTQKSGGCWVNVSEGRWQRQVEAQWQRAGSWIQGRVKTSNNFPVTCVSWNDAVAFARWLSELEGKLYRLPTEQQWEVACRAGTSEPFSFGQCLDSSGANYALQGPAYGSCRSMPGGLPPQMLETGGRRDNPWGLSDMHGNAAEWCLDRYAPYGRTGRELAPQDLLRNAERIIRGGHFASPADQCRSARRSSFKPEAAANVIGFRLTQLP